MGIKESVRKLERRLNEVLENLKDKSRSSSALSAAIFAILGFSTFVYLISMLLTAGVRFFDYYYLSSVALIIEILIFSIYSFQLSIIQFSKKVDALQSTVFWDVFCLILCFLPLTIQIVKYSIFALISSHFLMVFSLCLLTPIFSIWGLANVLIRKTNLSKILTLWLVYFPLSIAAEYVWRVRLSGSGF